MPTLFPDYDGGSIANLMQSIAGACGAGKPAVTGLPELSALSAERLGEARHIVLLVIDGLGERTLRRGKAPTLQRHAVATMTSVFPSTTASAITTFMTGLPPSQHGLTGWNMHLDEIDQTLAILPLVPRQPPAKFRPEELPPRLFSHPSLFERLDRESWVLAPQKIAGSPFNAWHSRGANTLAYNSMPEMFGRLRDLLREAKTPRFIYAYFANLDTHAHNHGTDSPKVQQTLASLDAVFTEFLRDVRGSDAWILATADHGFIDSPPERVIDIADYPEIAALLARPLCGERRVAYCYVAPENRSRFEEQVREQLAYCCELKTGTELIAAGAYGPPPHHPQLASRIGDYVLLMQDNWTIKDWLPGEKRHEMLGVHGGTSEDEMRVPLIAVRV